MADGMSVAAMLAQGAGVVPARAVVDVVADERIAGRRLNASHVARLERAQALASGSLNDRRRAAVLVRAVQAELAAEAEAEAVQADMGRAAVLMPEASWESVEEVEWLTDRDGLELRDDEQQLLEPKVRHVTRVRRTDGIETLFQAGRLNEIERGWAMAYRAMWASALPPVRASSFEGSQGGRVDREAGMAAAMERGFAACGLGEVHAAVGPVNARILQAVAGEGRTIWSLGGSYRRRESQTEALKDSLRIASELLQKRRSRSLDSPGR